MAKTGAERQASYREKLKEKNKELTVFVPDCVSEQLYGHPGKLVDFFKYAEQRLKDESKAYERDMKQAALQQIRAAVEPTKEEILANYRALGLSIIHPDRLKELWEDIADLKAQREKLKTTLGLRIKIRKDLNREIRQNRGLADSYVKLFQGIHKAFTGVEAREAVEIIADIEGLLRKLELAIRRNRDQAKILADYRYPAKRHKRRKAK